MPPIKSYNSNMVTMASPSNKQTLIRPGVVTATVISSTELASSTSINPQIKINLQLTGQTLSVISNSPLAAGDKVQLTILSDKTAIIDNLEPKKNNSIATQSRSLDAFSSIAQSASAAQHSSTPTQAALTTHSPPNFQQLINNGLKQALPQQQPLSSVIPALLNILTDQNGILPPEIKQSLSKLMAAVPTNEQLSIPASLKKALLNNGIFLEAKLKQLLTTQELLQSPQKPAQNRLFTDVVDNILRADNKANTQQLIQQILRLLTPNTEQSTPQPIENPNGSTISSLIFLQQLLSAHKPSNTSTAQKAVDITLLQLAKLLIANLANTQINQLETAQQRLARTNDDTINNLYWAFELPINNGKQIDKLALTIEEQQTKTKDKKSPKNWVIMLSFDLHVLGKLSVELTIVEKTVAATIWSELEKTHHQVQNHIQHLRDKLEAVGVNVKDMKCLLGQPNKESIPTSSLVDIHT